MKTTLCLATAIVILAILTPLAHAVDPTAWNTKINGPGRFTVLTQFNKEAVFDKETGLVWERSPSTSLFPWSSTTITTAATHCNQLTTGGRLGWRLPTIQELASLVDPSVASPGPTLPSGHPFDTDCSTGGCVQSSAYWSATTSANTINAWYVVFNIGLLLDDVKGSNLFVWCVRGGQGVDPQ